MSDGSVGLDLFAAITAGADGISEALGRDQVCAVLFWGEHPEAEVVHRHQVPEDVCRALTTSGGRQVADEVRRSGQPIRIATDSLPLEARELKASLESHGLGSLAVFP